MVAFVFMLAACGTAEPPTATEEETPDADFNPADVPIEERYGGTIRIGQAAPPHLDQDRSTMQEVTYISVCAVEGLMTLNGYMQPVPQLAESVEISDDGLTYTFKIREDVKFHNGKTMTMDDVLASFEYWLNVNSTGMEMAAKIQDHKRIDDTHFSITTKQVMSSFLGTLANNQGGMQYVIRPQEVIDKAMSDGSPAEMIGTGPYMLSEYIPDQHCKLVPFPDYQPANEEPANGWSGDIHAYADELIFKFVPEVSTRIAAVQAGDLDYAGAVPADQYTLLKDDEKVKLLIGDYNEVPYVAINCSLYPFSDIRARQAANYAANITDLAIASCGDQQFWTIEGSIFNHNMKDFYVENAGEGIFNNYDPDQAKALLEEMAYDGTPIVLLQSQDDAINLNVATLYKQQLEAVGFVVDLQVFDRATVNDIRSKETGWNLHSSCFGNSYFDPIVFASWAGTNGWITRWNDEYSQKTDEIFVRMDKEIDPAKRYEIIKEWNNYFYETLPYIRLMSYGSIYVISPKLQGFGYAFPDEGKGNIDIRAFNLWLSK